MPRLIYAALCFCFIFVMTVLGAACVFFAGKGKKTQLLQGASAGIMLAASFWSLLMPSLGGARELFAFPAAAVALSVSVGAAFIYFLDLFCVKAGRSGDKNGKIFWAITLHNIPEGLAVGIAFGSCGVSLTGAIGVALAIGIQNFPEGMATAVPMNNALQNKKKAFLAGVLSGAVEPLFAVFGLVLAEYAAIISPLALSFAAGAMIYVCSSELIPDGCKTRGGNITFTLGFILMTFLDILFG